MSITLPIKSAFFLFLFSLSVLYSFGQGYIRDKKNACQVFMMSDADKRSCSWDGPCKDGYAEGFGDLNVYKNDTLIFHYKGQLKEGKYINEGEFFYPNGAYRKSHYDFTLNKTGATYIKEPDGTIFIGEYAAVTSGTGAYTRINANGDKYVGWFEKNIFTNENNPDITNWIYYKSGITFKGNTRNDQHRFFKSGVVYYPNGDSLVLGMTVSSLNDIAKGTYYFSNGNVIAYSTWGGTYEATAVLTDSSKVAVFDKKQSIYFGWRTYPDGTRYTGCMKDLEPFYIGMIMHPDGTSRIGYFDGIKHISTQPNSISTEEKYSINMISHFDFIKSFKEIMRESKNPYFDVLILLQKLKKQTPLIKQLEDSLASLTTRTEFNFTSYKNHYFDSHPSDTTGFIRALDFQYCHDVYKQQTEEYLSNRFSQNADYFFELLLNAQYEFYSGCMKPYLFGLTTHSAFSFKMFQTYYTYKYPSDTTGLSLVLANLYSKNIYQEQIKEYFFKNNFQASTSYSNLNDRIFSDSISGFLKGMRKDLGNMKMEEIPTQLSLARQLIPKITDEESRLNISYILNLFQTDYYFENYQFEEAEKLLIEIYPFKNDHFVIGGRLLRIYALMNMSAAGDTILQALRNDSRYASGIPDRYVSRNFESLSGYFYFLKMKRKGFGEFQQYFKYPEPTNGHKTPDFNINIIKNLLITSELGAYNMDNTKFLRRVSNLCQAELGEYHPLSIVALENVIFYNGGNYSPDDSYSPEQCQQLLDTTLQMLLDYYPLHSEQLQKSLFKRAVCAQSPEEAKKCFDLYFQSKQAQIENVFPHLSSYMKRMYFSKFQNQAQTFYRKCYFYSDPANYSDPKKVNYQFIGDFYNEVIRNKGFLLGNEIALKRKIMVSKDTALIADYKDLVALKNDFSRYTLFSPDELKLNNISISNIEKEIIEKERALEKSVGTDVESTHVQSSWKDIQKKLKAGQAAIEIVKAYTGNSFNYYVLYVDGKTKGHPVVLYLTDSVFTEKQIYAYYRNSISSRMKDTLSYSILWKKIDSMLVARKIKTLYFSPDGIYHLMNVQTFLAKDTYVADKYQIIYLNNTKEILSPKMNVSPTNAALYGDPDYSSVEQNVIEQNWQSAPERSFQGALMDASFTPLPGTAEEIKNISKNLQLRNISTTVMEQDSATEVNFKKTQHVSMLHVATHGFFMPSSSGSFDAMLYSGIALAGANNAYKNTIGENGIVTAYEVKDMNLAGTSMVVLSACETGLGENAGFEGVYGLKRALQIAGAHYVISSLWKVDDNTTQLLMSNFYKNLGEGQSIHQAFLLAQKTVRKEYPHPYYWGAFVITGY